MSYNEILQERIRENNERISELREQLDVFNGIGGLKKAKPDMSKCPICGRETYCEEATFMGRRYYYVGFECDCHDSLVNKSMAIENKIDGDKKALMQYSKCNLGERFQEEDFDSFDESLDRSAYETCFEYAEEFDKDESTGLIINSSIRGNGKTHLATAIMHKVILDKNTEAIFISGYDLVRCVMEDKWGRIHLLPVDELVNTDLLVIDDIGLEGVSGAVARAYYQIIDSRYKRRKPVIITTNMTSEKLKNLCYDKDGVDAWRSTLSRLYETCEAVKVTGNDYRRKKVNQLPVKQKTV